MARINLLPWRAERRRQRQKEAMTMLALSALGAVLLSFAILSFYKGQVAGQNVRNNYLQERIAEVDEQIVEIEALDEQRARLLARKEVIERLQANRSQMVHLFDSLVRTIPDGVVLTTIKQDGEVLTLTGRAQSNTRVSTYMRNLEGSGWMTRPELSIIEAKGFEKGLPYEFSLTVRLANPTAPVDEDGDGIPDPVPPVSDGLDADGLAAGEMAAAADAEAPVDAGEVPAGGDATAGEAAAQDADVPAEAAEGADS